MGIFDFWKSPDQRRADEVRSGARAPTKSERQKCWDSRDLYFACLDRADILDAAKQDRDARRACPAETAQFETDCAREWVKYFKNWRVAEVKKRKQLEELQKQGGVQMDVTASFGDRKDNISVGDIQAKLAERRK